MASAEKPPFFYLKVKATAFGKDWAQSKYGRGFTKRFMYGKYIGPGKQNSRRILAEWDDGQKCEAQLSKCTASTKAECLKACKASTERKADKQSMLPLFCCVIHKQNCGRHKYAHVLAFNSEGGVWEEGNRR